MSEAFPYIGGDISKIDTGLDILPNRKGVAICGVDVAYLLNKAIMYGNLVEKVGGSYTAWHIGVGEGGYPFVCTLDLGVPQEGEETVHKGTVEDAELLLKRFFYNTGAVVALEKAIELKDIASQALSLDDWKSVSYSYPMLVAEAVSTLFENLKPINYIGFRVGYLPKVYKIEDGVETESGMNHLGINITNTPQTKDCVCRYYIARGLQETVPFVLSGYADDIIGGVASFWVSGTYKAEGDSIIHGVNKIIYVSAGSYFTFNRSGLLSMNVAYGHLKGFIESAGGVVFDPRKTTVGREYCNYTVTVQGVWFTIKAP